VGGKKGTEITTKITKGQSPKWQGFDYQQEGILFVTSENIQNGYIDISKPKYLPLEFNNKIKNSQLKKGDILINIVGASIGRCAIFNIDVECANTNQAVCVFRPNAENDSMFLSLYLQSETTQNRLFRSQVETARANLSLGDFRKFKFVIPQKEEQINIANRINQFNIEIEKQVERINVLERLKKSLMQNLLTGKIKF
jgi:restriction endonuclease S subunit